MQIIPLLPPGYCVSYLDKQHGLLRILCSAAGKLARASSFLFPAVHIVDSLFHTFLLTSLVLSWTPRAYPLPLLAIFQPHLTVFPRWMLLQVRWNELYHRVLFPLGDAHLY